MKQIAKMYSRERSLFYLFLWYHCDAQGIQRYLGTSMAEGAFIMRPDGRSEVWYNEEEFSALTELSVQKLGADKQLADRVLAGLYSGWERLKPYFEGGKKLETVEDAEEYFLALVEFWVGWNSVFFELPDHADVPAEFVQKSLALRPQTEKYSNQMNQLFFRFVEDTFPILKPYAKVILPTELRSFVQDFTSAQSLLQQRLAEGCFLFRGQAHPLSEMEAVLAAADVRLETVEGKQIAELRGIVAHAGKVHGRVRCAFTKADMAAFQPGEILVTEMTNPDYVHIMKQAAAIITDEGGMLCHAAIVSRELQKPCIIGTKIATQVLKDGDLVEVDADNGVVRVLEKTGVESGNQS